MGFFKFLRPKSKKAQVRPKPRKQKPRPWSMPAQPAEEREIAPRDMSLDEADLDPQIVNVDRRQHQRINRGQIIDEDIKAYCRSLTSGQSCNALVIDISPGGLLLLADTPFQVNEELFISCRVGMNFRMKERGIVKMSKGRKFGVEFDDLSEESHTFLTQLYGAIAFRTRRD